MSYKLVVRINILFHKYNTNMPSVKKFNLRGSVTVKVCVCVFLGS